MNNINETIKPNQSESIHDHEWSDPGTTAKFEEGRIVIHANYGASDAHIYLRDAEIIAKHFDLIPDTKKLAQMLWDSPIDTTQSQSLKIKHGDGRRLNQEYLNGELVVNIDTGPDLEIGGAGGLGKFNGFMSEDRE